MDSSIILTKSKRVFSFLAILSAMVLSVSQASAAPIKVLFLGFDNGVSAVKTDILGSDSRFDLVNSSFLQYPGSVSLATLQQYDSVLVWTNGGPSAGTGNALADYADAGGGVVLATFSGQSMNGRIMTSGYTPLTAGGYAYNPASLGSYDASSPLMAGVTSLSSSVYNSDFLSVNAGANVVAYWNNGRALAALNAGGNVAAISLFPNVAQYGHASGDYQQLFRNALVETANPSSASVPDGSSTVLLFGMGVTGLLIARNRKHGR